MPIDPSLEIVSLAEVKLFLRVDQDYEDAVLAIMIEAATEAAIATADAYAIEDEPPARLKLAVLTHVAQAYDNRTDTAAPAGNDRLLAPLRNLDI